MCLCVSNINPCLSIGPASLDVFDLLVYPPESEGIGEEAKNRQFLACETPSDRRCGRNRTMITIELVIGLYTIVFLICHKVTLTARVTMMARPAVKEADDGRND